MKKVVMILSITMISLATIEGADTPQDEKEIKSFLAVSVKVPDQSDGATQAPTEVFSEIPVRLKFGRRRVKSMELANTGVLVPSRRSAQDIFKILTGQQPADGESQK